jgi:small subunit ribosomal protein S17
MGSLEKAQIGTVVSNKMDKTVVVRIDRQKRHRLYRKTITRSQRYKAHDENNECRLGDIVRIAETRPLSRDKRWRVVEILQKGDVAEIAPIEVGQSLFEEISEAQQAIIAARQEEEARERARAQAEAEARDATQKEDAPVSEAEAEEEAAAAGEEPDDIEGGPNEEPER